MTHPELPRTTLAEEVANGLTGAVGLLASILGLAGLVAIGFGTGDATGLVAGTVYGATLVLLYSATTLYHTERDPTVKRSLRILDHCAVYLLIAGTYTPVALVGLGGRTGWVVAATAWSFAVVGILFKVFRRFRHPGLSVGTYLAMGWLGLLVARPALDALSLEAVALLAGGGLAYTVGTVVFGLKRLPFHHAVWHLFVIAGSACHWVAIAGHVLPAPG